MSLDTLVQSIQSASDSWHTFGWTEQQSHMDQTLKTAKDAREHSLTARKKLADETKQFRRSVKTLQQAATALQQDMTPATSTAAVKASEALAKDCRGIVSLYQEEIDNLTRRCKSAETAYANNCQALRELPDPAAVLAVTLEQLQSQQAQIAQLLSTVEKVSAELEDQQKNKKNKESVAAQQSNSSGGGGGMSRQDREELIQLRREVAEYEVEFRSLKNQDITIRKLEAKIAEMQTAGEVQLKVELEKATEELAETEGRRAAEALEREAAMERKVQTLELQLKAERAGREATQTHLLEADEGVSRREAAWEARLQILIADSDRLREDLQVATRERDQLRLECAALQGHDSRHHHLSSSPHSTPPVTPGVSVEDLMSERAAYQTEVSELSETNTLLREELRFKEEALAEEKRTNQTKIYAMEREMATLKNNLVSLESQLASAPSQAAVESMKRELRILKRLEYNAGDIESDERDPEIAGGHEDAEKDLETVLVSKLRRAETELISERNSRKHVATECESLRKALADSEKAKEEADKLVLSLERDLANAIQTTMSPGKGGTRKKITVMAAPENPETLQSILDMESPPPSSVTVSPVPTTKASASVTDKAEDDHSVATIVMAQRDRLRARCDALEAERDAFRRELQAQVQATESLKTDNTKLYEKMRYLQSFNKGGSSNRAARLDRDLDLEALEQRYEASVDPFRQFNKAERQRKLSEMSPMEHTVFVVARTVLATKEMRTALFFYVLVLHMLVFLTTYHWSHANECYTINNEHLSHLPPNAAQHIRDDLGGSSGQGGN